MVVHHRDNTDLEPPADAEGAEIMVVHHRDNADLEPPQMKRVQK